MLLFQAASTRSFLGGAKVELSTGKQAQELAKLWGQEFGNPVFTHTLGMMKNYLRGNAEKGIPAYSYGQLERCIKWLAKGQAEGKLKKPVKGPGVIAYVIADFIDGKPVEDTFLGYEKPMVSVVML